jgi:hypothetical protein
MAIGVPTEDGSGHSVILNGMLWLPQEQPRAAVVFAIGSGGWRDYREGHYGRILAAAGYVALAAADGNYLPTEKERFQVAIAFYPGCNFHPRVPKPTSVVFLALGEKNDYTGDLPRHRDRHDGHARVPRPKEVRALSRADRRGIAASCRG